MLYRMHPMYSYLSIGRASDIPVRRERLLYRAFEIFPGTLAWVTIAAIVILSFVTPLAMAFFVILFDVYWLIKSIYLAVHMRSSFVKMRRNIARDWLAELETVRPPSAELADASWHDIYHLVVLPFSIEPLSVVRDCLTWLTKSSYPLDKLIVVLAAEERAGEPAQAILRASQEEFGNTFFRFLTTTHPDNIAGEVKGKGANESWAGRRAQELIDTLAVPYNHVITSVFDIDTVVPSAFFACLTWHYLTAAKPLRSSFQPIPLYTNNIWEAPAFARVFSFSTTFWQMVQQARPEILITFSSQSISFRALVEAGFWQTNAVSEDSQIFWKCFLRYDGDWRTVPLFYPVYMDANVAPTFWQTAKNQYKQIRRWAYGVENNPYFLFGFLRNWRISLRQKLSLTWYMTEQTHSLATNSFIIFVLGWLPLVVGGPEFSRSLLAFNLPVITRTIMTLAMVGLVTSAILSVFLLPPRPPNYGKLKYLWMFFQWILFPINLVLFGAVPALDAQTRLMLGKYMGFWVTPKSRQSITQSG